MSAMKLTAAGDAMIFRRLPGAYAGFEAVRDLSPAGISAFAIWKPRCIAMRPTPRP